MSESNYVSNLEHRLKQFELVYDYIKFHIGLYIGTPPVIAILGVSLGVDTELPFQLGLCAMIIVYFISGVSAGKFMSIHINERWKINFLDKFEKTAFEKRRRRMHHGLYWAGLIAGLSGLSTALVMRAVAGIT